MSGAAVEARATVYMNRRDVTKWVESFRVRQAPNATAREFSVTFAGWNALEAGATWDIYGTSDVTVPRADVVMFDGYVPPDRTLRTTVRRGEVPHITVSGYDWPYRAFRRAPKQTLVLASRDSYAEQALDRYQGVLGARIQTRRVRTLHEAVGLLGEMAGFRVVCSIPDFQFSAAVVPPTSSYHQAILDLTSEFAPICSTARTSRTMVLQDPEGTGLHGGAKLVLSEAAVEEVTIQPTRFSTVTRVIMRVRSCR